MKPPLLFALLGCTAFAPLAYAGQFSYSLVAQNAHFVTWPDGPGGSIDDSVWQCVAGASGRKNPSETTNTSYTRLIRCTYVADDESDTPPATIKVSYKSTFSGGWKYSMGPLTPPTGAVSASFYVTATLLSGATTHLEDSSGTISQTEAGSFGACDPEPFVIKQATNMTVAPVWVKSGLTYKFDYKQWDVSGNASATASTPVGTVGAHWQEAVQGASATP